MNWRKHDAYAIVSECGRYSICSIGYNGGRAFEAWRTRAHAEGPHLISTNLESAEAARAACEADDAG